MHIDEIELKIENSKKKYDEICKVVDVDDLKVRLADIEKQIHSMTSFDAEKSKTLNRQRKVVDSKLEKMKALEQFYSSVSLYMEILQDDVDDVLEREFFDKAEETIALVNSFWIETLLNEKFDECSAILTVHSGAGGEEAQDWAEMLARMYLRYAEKQNYDAYVIDAMPGDGAGIKSETIKIDGDKAFGFLKCESGVHRLVRLSPFDANNRRHTSFASIEVSPLVKADNEIQINPKDLKIDTYRSSGAGGQHVNKTESAIRITHIPTGIVVACQNERSQIQNREMAMQILYGKLAEKQEREKREQELKMRGESKKIEWGSQIRSYILHPYNLVKDHRTNIETSDTTSVLDGELQMFINGFLQKRVEDNEK